MMMMLMMLMMMMMMMMAPPPLLLLRCLRADGLTRRALLPRPWVNARGETAQRVRNLQFTGEG